MVDCYRWLFRLGWGRDILEFFTLNVLTHRFSLCSFARPACCCYRRVVVVVIVTVMVMVIITSIVTNESS